METIELIRDAILRGFDYDTCFDHFFGEDADRAQCDVVNVTALAVANAMETREITPTEGAILAMQLGELASDLIRFHLSQSSDVDEEYDDAILNRRKLPPIAVFNDRVRENFFNDAFWDYRKLVNAMHLNPEQSSCADNMVMIARLIGDYIVHRNCLFGASELRLFIAKFSDLAIYILETELRTRSDIDQTIVRAVFDRRNP